MKNVFIVAELSANHGHKLSVILDSVREAHRVGADAVKIQTYTADTLTIDSDRECFRIQHGTRWDGTTLYKLYQEAFTPWEWHQAIKDETESLGMTFFSTPFDRSATDYLERLGVGMYKVASFEITDTPLIEYVAAKGKPVILSTGISTLAEIEAAVNACRKVGNNDITLLQCTSEYPADPAEANLLTIPNMRETFGVKVGLSDHTEGSAVAISAVALGATVVEKHFILDREIGGPDAGFSMEPPEFEMMVKSIRIVEKALGKVEYGLTESKKRARFFSRSLFIAEDIVKGTLFDEKNIRSVRPGLGMSPSNYSEIIGKRARMDLSKGTPLTWECVDWAAK